MKDLTKWISVFLCLTSTSQPMGLQNFVQQPSNLHVPFRNNEQTMKMFQPHSPHYQAMPPFSLDHPMPAFPLHEMPFELPDFNVQYQPPQIMPPVHLNIQFMPPPVYRFEAARPFMPLPPQMSAPNPFVLAPLATTVANETTTTPPLPTKTAKDITTNDDGTKNKSRRSVVSVGIKRFEPRFNVMEDTETKVIDTWRDTNDFRYFSNWWMGGPRPQVNYFKQSYLKHYRNKHVSTTQHPLPETARSVTKEQEPSKKQKNMVRVVPIKKDILREVSAKLRQLREQGKAAPFVAKLSKDDYDKHGALSKVIDFHTPLKEDKITLVQKITPDARA